ncbi:MAG: hypothetical protein KAU21_20885 [Gammaproteobacteria bacterium]|nr:hypothetical protein [Gammaproteobacteria bacterium]
MEGEKKKRGSTHSVETFYRNAYRTQLGLADMKANIMISINGLIITAIIATEGLSTFTTGSSIYLLMVLLCGCISSMVFAILAARPRVSKLVVSEQDMMTGKVNLLYFNNFQSVTEEKYAEAMWNLIGRYQVDL